MNEQDQKRIIEILTSIKSTLRSIFWVLVLVAFYWIAIHSDQIASGLKTLYGGFSK